VEVHHSARKHRISEEDIVVLMLDGGREMAIHAMKARPQYFDLLP
jgi:hypothetical protein